MQFIIDRIFWLNEVKVTLYSVIFFMFSTILSSEYMIFKGNFCLGNFCLENRILFLKETDVLLNYSIYGSIKILLVKMK